MNAKAASAGVLAAASPRSGHSSGDASDHRVEDSESEEMAEAPPAPARARVSHLLLP